MLTSYEKTEVLENPEKLPLNLLYINKKTIVKKSNCPTDKIKLEDVRSLDSIDFSKYYTFKFEKHKAISSLWLLKEREYHEFQPYYYNQHMQQDETFVENNLKFLESIRHLLECSYRYFWCYILCEPRVGKAVNSFIQNPISCYDIKYMSSSCLDTYELICNVVYRIFERLLTFRVSETEYMTEEFVIENLIKTNYLNVKNVMNFILIYTPTNVSSFVDKLLFLFLSREQEEQIQKELSEILGRNAMEMEMIEAEVCEDYEGSLIMADSIRKRPSPFDPGWLEDVISKILYIGSLLKDFFSKNTSFIDVAVESGITERIVPFYENVYSQLVNLIASEEEILDSLLDVKERIFEKMAFSRLALIEFFNCYVSYLIDNIVKNGENPKEQQICIDKYLSVITSALEYEEFIQDYHEIHKVDEQLQIISDIFPDIDTTRTVYILDSLTRLTENEKEEETSPNVEDHIETNAERISKSEDLTSGSQEKELENKSKPSEEELSELIRIVLDACPNVGCGFICKCLEEMNYDPIETIQAIQTNNLADNLNKIPRNEVLIPVEEKSKSNVAVLAYRGKKPQHEDALILLDDKSDIQNIKDFVLKTSYGNYDFYDDEFDDRLDIDPPLHLERSDELYEADFSLNRNNDYEVVSDPSDSSEAEEQDDKPEKVKDAFCENPEVIRARQEAKRQNQYHRRRGGKTVEKSVNQDVVGKPKGQGQSKDTQISRDKKNVQKSNRANHNRKGGAQWKRSRGMVPS